jgi:hypothetical protein
MAERPLETKQIYFESGVPLARLARDVVSAVDISPSEAQWIGWIFDRGIEQLRKVSPVIAADIAAQKNLAIRMAGVAKATFPVRKNYSFPSVPGSLGAAWLFPQGLKWVSSPNSSNPCYSDYTVNSWDISMTAGTAAYLLGSSANFYKANPTTDQHTFVLIFDKGVIEVGTSPSIDQFIMLSQGKQDFGIYTVEPLVDIPVEANKVVYQYPTPMGAVWVDHSTGIKWSFMPRRTGTATIRLLGMLFYEHDFASSLKWVS